MVISLILLKINKLSLKPYLIIGIIFFITSIIIAPKGQSQFEKYFKKKDYYSAYHVIQNMPDTEKNTLVKDDIDLTLSEYEKLQNILKTKYSNEISIIKKLIAENKYKEAFEKSKIIKNSETRFDEFNILYSKIETQYLEEKYKDDFKKLAVFAKKGNENGFLELERKLSKKFPNSEKIQKLKSILYSIIFANDLKQAKILYKTAGTNKTKYIEAGKLIEKILSKDSSHKMALQLKNKVDKVLSYFDMSDYDLTKKLKIINFRCYKYNHPFTMTACTAKIKNPTPIKAKDLEIKWTHLSETDEELDSTSKTFKQYLNPFTTRSFTRKGILYTGSGKHVSDSCEVSDAEWLK